MSVTLRPMTADVFGGNDVARRRCASHGYEVVTQQLRTSLG